MSRINTLNVRRAVAVFMAVVMMILSLSYTGNNQVDATNTSRQYYVYNAKTGVKINRYTLNPLQSSNNKSRANVPGIFGDDDRKVDNECNGVVFISCGGGIGTGFIIDDHIIATAAHCVCDRYNDKGIIINKISVLNKTGSSKFDITPVESHVPKEFVTESDIDGYDYALITVKENLSSYPHFEIGVALNNSIGAEVKISGFPGVVDGSVVNNGIAPVIYTGIGNIININNTQILTNVDATPGNSGGPLYVEEEMNIDGNKASYKTAIGVFSSIAGYQDGTTAPNVNLRFTTDHIHFYKANENVKWE